MEEYIDLVMGCPGYNPRLALTNYGLRCIDACIAGDERLVNGNWSRAEQDLLSLLRRELVLPVSSDQTARRLLEAGLIAPVDEKSAEGISSSAIALRYARNPLEHVSRVIFEFTSRCNFSCAHCYNAAVPRATETDLPLLEAAAESFSRMGIRRFDFVGGEVSRYGHRWLELAEKISRHAEVITLYTNGWWLGPDPFRAAGIDYPSTAAYLDHLRSAGVTHILFSLDGDQAAHDRSRGQPGLFARILAGLSQTRAAGIAPRVSLLCSGGSQEAFRELTLRLAEEIYTFPRGTDEEAKVKQLAEDPTNKINWRIDVGNGAGSGRESFSWDTAPPELFRCKAFFRPAPSLTIKASGELATCRIATAGEGYGNIHEQPLVTILNRMQEATVFKVHAEGLIDRYRGLVDRRIFGERFSHFCTARAILTQMARIITEGAIDTRDAATRLEVNRQVARATGHLVEG